MIDPQLRNQVALVTGANAGIGAAIARALGAQARWITGQVLQVAGGHAL